MEPVDLDGHEMARSSSGLASQAFSLLRAQRHETAETADFEGVTRCRRQIAARSSGRRTARACGSRRITQIHRPGLQEFGLSRQLGRLISRPAKSRRAPTFTLPRVVGDLAPRALIDLAHSARPSERGANRTSGFRVRPSSGVQRLAPKGRSDACATSNAFWPPRWADMMVPRNGRRVVGPGALMEKAPSG